MKADIVVNAEQETSPFANASALRAAGPGEIRLVSLKGNASLFAGLTFPRLRQSMDKLPANWVAVGAIVGGLPAGLALGYVTDDGQAELMSLVVAAGNRCWGIGKRLLESWMSDALSRGARSMSVRFAEKGQKRQAFRALLAGAGWTLPAEDGLIILGRAGTMLEAGGTWPSVSQRLAKQTTYSFDTLCLTETDRQRLNVLLALSDAAHMQGPLRLWPQLEPEVSCLVRREGELVGWVLAGPAREHWRALSGADTFSGTPGGTLIEYHEAYLDPRYWHTAIAVAAYYHCYKKQVDVFGSQSLALYHTDSSRPRMVHLTRRRFAPIADRVETIFRSDGPSSVTSPRS